MNNYVIKNYEKSYEKQLLNLSDITLGESYITKDDLTCFLEESNKKCFLLVDSKVNALAGFCFYDICSFEEAQKDSRNYFPTSLQNETFGHVRTIAVNPNYQGQRLGNFILDSCVETFRKLNINLLYTTIWDKPESRSNVKMVEHGGFRKAITLQDYWLEDSIKQNYKCPICGYPCHCSCIIMTNFDI